MGDTVAQTSVPESASDRVAMGRRRPKAPTHPYVPTLEHTVPLIMGLLREAEAWIALREPEQAGRCFGSTPAW